ncbi:MAG: hypothetical protein RML37_06465 [Chitinophagales bacterium]|nr:hypothetical protein [Chitinophagales bacterium]
MILIAESGSTKTNWLAASGKHYETIGFNPLFFSSDEIYEELMKHDALAADRGLYTKVFFYGAACSSEERNNIVLGALRRFFTHAGTLAVDHDLKAAAIATYTGEPGIACILGTGSNSCLYDGRQLTEVVPALGYVLGDEGSGAYFGKKLLALYLYNRLPEGTASLIRNKYGYTKEKIFDMVYRQPNANRKMAALTMVLSESPDKAFVHEFVKQGFREFFEYHVCCYENYRQYPLHFVGSLAEVFKEELREVAAEYGCRIGIIDRQPVYNMLRWHVANDK